MPTFFRIIRDVAIMVLIVFLLFEVTLRFVPSLIPPSFLVYFNSTLRASIADRLLLPTKESAREIVRDDGGPSLTLYGAEQTVQNQFSDFGSKDVTVDELGFCNRKNSYNSNSIELLAIGDSFTFCTNVGVEESWTALLSGLVDKDTYNLGSPGKGLYEYLQILKTFGLEKNPQVVIMAVYEGNDLRDAITYTKYRRGHVDTTDPNDCGGGRLCDGYMHLLHSRAGTHSYAFNMALVSVRLLRGTLHNNAAQKDIAGDFTYTMEGPEGMVVLNPDDVDQDEIAHAIKLQKGEISLDVFDEALQTFYTLSEEHAFIPILVYIPSAYTTYSEYISFENPALHEIMPAFSAKQRAYFAAKAKELGMTFIDTTPALMSAAESHRIYDRLLYFPHNVHLTPFGHEVVAEALSRAF